MSIMKKIKKKVNTKNADVPVAAVSRTMNDSPEIKKATKEKILNIVKETKYHPNINARRLVQQKSNNIGIVFPCNTHIFIDWYLVQLLDDLQVAINKYNYNFSIYFPDQSFDFSPLRFYEEGRVDAMIIGGLGLHDKYVNSLLDLSYKFVLLGSYVDNINVNYVDINNKQTVKDGIKYLYEKGHRKIGIVLDDMQFSTGRDRYNGFLEGLKEVGLPFRKSYVLPYETSSNIALNNAVKLLKRKNRPTVIFAMSDLKALDVYKAAETLNLKIPEDISVLSIDDTILTRAFFSPPLTTYQISTKKLAETTADFLIKKLIKEDADSFQPVLIKPNLRERHSVFDINKN